MKNKDIRFGQVGNRKSQCLSAGHQEGTPSRYQSKKQLTSCHILSMTHSNLGQTCFIKIFLVATPSTLLSFSSLVKDGLPQLGSQLKNCLLQQSVDLFADGLYVMLFLFNWFHLVTMIYFVMIMERDKGLSTIAFLACRLQSTSKF